MPYKHGSLSENKRGIVETIQRVTITNGTENSTTCFKIPNYNDTSFLVLLTSADPSIMFGNSAAAITIYGTQ